MPSAQGKLMRIKLQKEDSNPKHANYGSKGPWDGGGAKNPAGPIKYKGGMVKSNQKAI